MKKPNKPWPERKRLRLKDFDYSSPNHVYFLAICARDGTSPFLQEDLSGQLVSSLLLYRKERGIRVYSFCVMPDHVHLVLSPAEDFSVSELVKGLKTYTAKVAQEKGVRGRIWQKSYYDHVVRKDESLVKICEYVLANPVRKRLAAKPEDWQFSGMLDPLPL
jgi:REP element-mobilizing transposase RayT